MGNNKGDIFIEADFNNIFSIDPNKVYDEFGNVQQRLVNHEELVMYVNLECDSIPRSKLQVGAGKSDTSRNITVATGRINFLNPGNKGSLDTSWTDSFTKSNDLRGDNLKNAKPGATNSPKFNEQSDLNQSEITEGIQGSTDTGLLGITAINYKINSAFLPQVSMVLEDIKGRALFESGDQSPYSVFFQMPYPLFYLTMKGWYGKAIRIPLQLTEFNASFNSQTGNFVVNLTFFGYRYSMVGEIPSGALIALPHMFEKKFDIQKINNPQNPDKKVEQVSTTKGVEAIRQIYSKYKSKGLIDEDFPELTVMEFINRMEKFQNNLSNLIKGDDMDLLTQVETFKKTVEQFESDVIFRVSETNPSWNNKYVKKQNPNNIILTRKNKNDLPIEGFVYEEKKEVKLVQIDKNARSDMSRIIQEYQKRFSALPLFNGVTFDISENDFYLTFNPNANDVDWVNTYKDSTGKVVSSQTDPEFIKFKDDISRLLALYNSAGVEYKQGETPNKPSSEELKIFLINYDEYNTKLQKIKDGYEEVRQKTRRKVAEKIRQAMKNKDLGLGFDPTIRNVTAVLYASLEAFIALMDETHTLAWNQRNDPQRKKILRNSESPVDKIENLGDPVYPWPQVVKKENENGGELYTLKYPGDDPNCRNSVTWPEVYFVEEFIKGLTQRNQTVSIPSVTNQNQLTNSGIVSLNTLDYPLSSVIYLNKEESKFLYEIWERIFSISFYSRLSKTNDGNIYSAIADFEVENLVNALKGSSLNMKLILKNYSITSQNIISILYQVSNQGLGQSWQLLIRELFNTTYIEGNILQSVTYIEEKDLKNVTYSSNTENNLISFLNNTKTNSPDFFDTYPFMNTNWVQTNLANGIGISVEGANNTNRTVFLNKTFKTITSFSELGKTFVSKPIINYIYSEPIRLGEDTFSDLKEFYNTRSPKSYVPSEGYLRYKDDIGFLTKQLIGPTKSLIQKSTSIFNTPIFINSILTANSKFRNRNFYPFTVPAYLLLNSLPLSTLREKMTTKLGPENVEGLDYVFSTLKKFSGLHQLPYAWILKYGSIWYRYKTWIETGVDILNNDWSDFQYDANYDPVNLDIQKHYNLNILKPDNTTESVDIVLQENSFGATAKQSVMNLGFYPNLIDEFNICYQGIELIKQGFNSGYPNNLINNAISNKELILLKSEATSSNTNNRENPVFRNQGFDPNDPSRVLTINAYSALATKLSANTQTEQCFILPSFGTKYNETVYECFKGDAVKPYNPLGIEVTGNTSVFNGSVRLVWGAPQYGYFNLSGLTKPTPDQYMKEIFSATSEQANFGFSKGEYSNISDVFGTFELKVLDFFEQEYLNFCRSIYDTENKNDLENFQSLFRSLMLIEKPKGSTYYDVLQDSIRKQNASIYSKLTQFLSLEKIVRISNPAAFDRKIFFSFANTSSANPNSPVIEDRYDYFPYQGNLPPDVTYLASLANAPTAWNALRIHVGFSDIPALTYKDGGSYITDFFRDMDVEFTETNVKNLSQLVKIYATQKLIDPSLNETSFKQKFKDYVTQTNKFKDGLIDSIFSNKKLKSELDVSESNSSANIDVNKEIQSPKIKVELWELFKAINDKWISGGDFESKTFFEDILFLDRASRDCGQDIIVDISKILPQLKGSFISSETPQGFTDFDKKNLRMIINTIITDHNFVIMPISGFMNFYGVQTPVKNAKPRVDDPLDLGNSLFGTFTEVDTRDSGSKMVCYYANKGSEQLKLDDTKYFYKNDTWNFNIPSNNPLINEPKDGYGLQNKVIGFTVDVGIQNQNIFTDIQLNQTPGKATSEALKSLTDLANQSAARGASSASVSLYNIYKTRSYSCNISMFGNVMIQPLMYFNLRHVPMFDGPYLIIDVGHDIRPGQFTTTITGVRQPIPVLGNISKEEAILRIESTYLAEIEKKINVNVIDGKPVKPDDLPPSTSQETNNFIINSFLGQKSIGYENCSDTLFGTAQSFAPQDPIKTTTTEIELSNTIKSVQIGGSPVNDDVKKLVYSLVWLESTSENSSEIVAYNNNFIGLPLNIKTINTYIANNPNKIEKTYSCINVGQDLYAFASFRDLKSCIEVICGKFKELTVGTNTNLNEEAVTDLLIGNWPSNSPVVPPNSQNSEPGSQNIKEKNKDEYAKILDKVKRAFISGKSVGLFEQAPPPTTPPPLPAPSGAPATPPSPTPAPAPSSGYDPNDFSFSMEITNGDCPAPDKSLNDGYFYVQKIGVSNRYVEIKMKISAPSTAGSDPSCGSSYEFLASNISSGVYGFGDFRLVSRPNDPVRYNGSGVNPQIFQLLRIEGGQGVSSNVSSGTYTLTKEYAFYTCNGEGDLISLGNGQILSKSATITIQL